MRRMIRTICFLLMSAAIAAGQSSAPAPQAAEKQQLMWQKVEQAVRDADKTLDGVLAVAVEDLTSGQKFQSHGDELMPTASTIKIAVLAELYHQTQLAEASAAS